MERHQRLTVVWGNNVQKVVTVSEFRGADFYRQRAGDMRRHADRALSSYLRETYLRIAVDWERMAEEVRAKESLRGASRGREPAHDFGSASDECA